MTVLAFPACEPLTPLCSRCRKADGGRVIYHPLFGRRSYCAKCIRRTDGSDEALTSEMADSLVDGVVDGGLDLGDWHAVRTWLQARHWTRAAVLGLSDAALAQARRRLRVRQLIKDAIGHGGEALAVLFAGVSWLAFGCFVPPVAHAAERAAALGPDQSPGLLTAIIPFAIVALLVILWLDSVLGGGWPSLAQEPDEDDAAAALTRWEDGR